MRGLEITLEFLLIHYLSPSQGRTWKTWRGSLNLISLHGKSELNQVRPMESPLVDGFGAPAKKSEEVVPDLSGSVT